MTHSSEMSRQIDQSYKNLLEKFNPAARQIITAGKAYLKALHGAAAASKIYIDSISKLCGQIDQCPTGATSDIGASLDQVVDVYREIQNQQNNILKAFFVDFLVPLESNLEKDAKVLQGEHKKFISTQKVREDALMKAEGNVRKQRKKKIVTKNSIDKEIKNYQVLEEERLAFDLFMDQSFRETSIQERRRYSFILERLCTLGRHHLSLCSRGTSLLQKHLDNWTSIATRGHDPDAEPSLHGTDNEGIYSSPEENIAGTRTGTPSKRRAQSLDGYLSDGERHSELTLTASRVPQRDQESLSSRSMSKSKSEYNLKNCNKDYQDGQHMSRKPSEVMTTEKKNIVRATFPFHANADNQLSFNESDVIMLIGERNKGWQYGENMRSHKIGWFPVAYTECLEDEDSAIGCSYNNDPPSLQSKMSYETSKELESPYLPSRGQSLDRLDQKNKYDNRKVRTRSSPPVPPKRHERTIPLQSPSNSLHQILIEEEKGRTYYSIPPPPGSSCTSDNQKSYETFNSHLFLTEDMEEDLESYEGSYREDRSSRRYEDKKITNFGAGHSSHSSPISPDHLQTRYRKSRSSSSRDSSTQCSEDSGISKEDNKQSTCTYSESCSKSCNSSWVTDSYDECSNRNSTDNECYNSYKSDGKGSPTFLRYLYPSYKDSTSSAPIRHSSIDGLDKPCEVESKKENWIASAFGTLGKKKKNLISPCAQKIASQKARKKNEKTSLQRSSSLLCLDMTNCTSSPEETYTSNYEDITYVTRTWNQKPKIEVLNFLPSPPPYDPPPLPINSSPTYMAQTNEPKSLPWSQNSSSTKNPQSSSGNSSWSESDGSCMEAYMVLKERNEDKVLNTENSPGNRKRLLTRSYTWASPDFKKPSGLLVTFKGKKKDKLGMQVCKKTKNKICMSSFANIPLSQTSLKKKNSFYQSTLPSTPQELDSILSKKEDVAPPLPPRKRPQIPLCKRKREVNILNYSEYMCQRLTNPDGTCRFDQRSYTTGQTCSAWYDLWGKDRSVGKLV